MSESPMNQTQENWLFMRFMRKRDARIWFGVITLLVTVFVVLNGFTASYVASTVDRYDTLSGEIDKHNVEQARREGSVDATLESINKTLKRLEAFMDKEK